MIYGDNPQKINEREDKLGLKTYSYAPQITAIMQAGNMYVYGINNPVFYQDQTGCSAGNVQQMLDLAANLPYVDGLYPFGELAALLLLAGVGTIQLGGLISDALADAARQSAEFAETARAYAASSTVAVVAAGSPGDPDDKWKPDKLKFESKQIGEKFGKHKYDYPQFKNYKEYMDYAKSIFQSPEEVIFDSAKGEYYYIRGNDLLRVSPNGDFISLYPGANTPRVIDALLNGGLLYGG